MSAVDGRPVVTVPGANDPIVRGEVAFLAGVDPDHLDLFVDLRDPDEAAGEQAVYLGTLTNDGSRVRARNELRWLVYRFESTHGFTV